MSPVIEGAGVLSHSGPVAKKRAAAWEYDFAVDGGTVGPKTMRGQNALPSGAVVTDAYLRVITPPTSGGAATIAVAVQSAGDVVAAAAFDGAPYSTAGVKKGAINGNTDPLLLTAQRVPTLTIAAAALTAGKVVLIVEFLAGAS